MWKAEIEAGHFNDGRYNVYGLSANGAAGAKIGLDSVRVMLLQKFVQDKMGPGSDKEKLWGKCVTAIHKRLYQFKQGENKENPRVKDEPDYDDEKAYIYC
jgi:hypothetical protein